MTRLVKPDFGLKTHELTLADGTTVQLTLNHALMLKAQRQYPEQVAIANRSIAPTREEDKPNMDRVYTILYVAHVCYCLYAGEEEYSEEDFYLLAGEDMMSAMMAFQALVDPNQKAAIEERG